MAICLSVNKSRQSIAATASYHARSLRNTLYSSRTALLHILPCNREATKMSDSLTHCPDFWRPNSLNLNTVDYRIWSVMQYRVYQTNIRDLDGFIDMWRGMQQSDIDDAIKEWRKRLRTCVRMNGGNFE